MNLEKLYYSQKVKNSSYHLLHTAEGSRVLYTKYREDILITVPRYSLSAMLIMWVAAFHIWSDVVITKLNAAPVLPCSTCLTYLRTLELTEQEMWQSML
jgi:hypothetical protein